MRDLSFVGRSKCWRRWWKRHSKGKYMFKPLISDVKRLCRRVVALPISVFQANIDWLFGVHIDRWTYISYSVFSSFRRSCRSDTRFSLPAEYSPVTTDNFFCEIFIGASSLTDWPKSHDRWPFWISTARIEFKHSIPLKSCPYWWSYPVGNYEANDKSSLDKKMKPLTVPHFMSKKK